MPDILGLPKMYEGHKRGEGCYVVLAKHILQCFAARYSGLEALVGVVGSDKSVHEHMNLGEENTQ